MFELPQPIQRSRIRHVLGREFHIAKRKVHWLMGGQTWASRSDSLLINYLKFSHQSLILRPLPGVDICSFSTTSAGISSWLLPDWTELCCVRATHFQCGSWWDGRPDAKAISMVWF